MNLTRTLLNLPPDPKPDDGITIGLVGTAEWWQIALTGVDLNTAAVVTRSVLGDRDPAAARMALDAAADMGCPS